MGKNTSSNKSKRNTEQQPYSFITLRCNFYIRFLSPSEKRMNTFVDSFHSFLCVFGAALASETGFGCHAGDVAVKDWVRGTC